MNSTRLKVILLLLLVSGVIIIIMSNGLHRGDNQTKASITSWMIFNRLYDRTSLVSATTELFKETFKDMNVDSGARSH